MPELPEIACLSHDMQTELTGKTITAIEVKHPKCLNLSPEEFIANLTNATIQDTAYHGKWIHVSTNRGWLLLNLGMGGELLHVTRQTLPAKYRLVFDFDDNTCLTINFWWFGYAHFVPSDGLAAHTMTARIGPNAIDLDAAGLQKLFKGQRARLKPFLLDQSKIAGIGNFYIHDILFLARLHPLRVINTLNEAEIAALAEAIHAGLQPALDKHGAFYELDLHGQKGGYTMDDILVAYKEGQPCPTCATPIQKLRTGSTTSFICPHCQV